MPRTADGLPLRLRITLLVGGVLALVLVVTGLMVGWRMERQAREASEEKVLLLARIVAASDPVREALAGRRAPAEVAAYAERIRAEAGVDYVVVMDRRGIRLSHPNPAQIGAHFAGGDEAEAFRGRSYLSTAEGTLGLSVRAFAPVREGTGEPVGAVAVGILQKGLDRAVLSVRRRILLGVLIGFGVGIPAAWFVASRIKRSLLGMEPGEIATLLEQRNALLHSAREGVVAVDREMRIAVLNGEARRLFARGGLSGELVGRNLEEVLPGSRMRGVMESGQPELDQEGQINGLEILTSRVPVRVGGRIVGAVATFRDRTELARLAEQLTGVRLYADALRAQTHEFMNKLHVILGLVRLEEHERLKDYIAEVAGRLDDEVGFVLQRIKDPVVAGFLLARFASAREQAITMSLDAEAFLPLLRDGGETHDLVLILGNLLENAAEALEGAERREVRIELRPEGDWLHLAVEDSGPGLPEGLLPKAFERGVSTKGEDRGLGLWQAARALEGRGGRLEGGNRPGGGAVFRARFPFRAAEEGP